MIKPFQRFMEVVKRSPVESVLIGVLLVGLSLVVWPDTNAQAQIDESLELKAAQVAISAIQNETLPYGQFPVAKLRGPYYVKTVTATAYNSVPWQTDSTPFTTASNTTVRHGVIAANFLPFGTKVTIPEYYGDQIFVVEDRMNPRYKDRIDIWMESIEEARKFGKRQVIIHVYAD